MWVEMDGCDTQMDGNEINSSSGRRRGRQPDDGIRQQHFYQFALIGIGTFIAIANGRREIDERGDWKLAWK